MRNIILIILLTVISTSCLSKFSYNVNQEDILLRGSFYKIDTTKNLFIYHFKSDTIDGIFVKPIKDTIQNKTIAYKKVRTNKIYKLILTQQFYSGSLNINNSQESIYMDDLLIWNNHMNKTYFLDCKNIKGGLIDNKFQITKINR